MKLKLVQISPRNAKFILRCRLACWWPSSRKVSYWDTRKEAYMDYKYSLPRNDARMFFICRIFVVFLVKEIKTSYVLVLKQN